MSEESNDITKEDLLKLGYKITKQKFQEIRVVGSSDPLCSKEVAIIFSPKKDGSQESLLLPADNNKKIVNFLLELIYFVLGKSSYSCRDIYGKNVLLARYKKRGETIPSYIGKVNEDRWFKL